MEADVSAVCAKGKHDAAGLATRHGTEAAFVSLAGRRVSVRQPSMRTADDVARGACAGQAAFRSTSYSAASLSSSSRMTRPSAVNAPGGFIKHAGSASR
jgi:hypothetical protein